jgi:hypothetical protein
VDKAFAISVGNILQTIACLISLMRANADDSAKVHAWANLVDERLQALDELLRPILRNPA